MPARIARLSHDATSSALAEALAHLRLDLEIPWTFPPDVLAEAERVADGPAIDGSDSDREDARDLDLLTIDPPGSRDLDQALHIARDGDAFHVTYAIADLPAFVRQGGAIDRESRRRGQTLYAPDGSVPLHPERISTDAASLIPDADRRAYLWRFHLDSAGSLIDPPSAPARGWVRSRRQWTYEEAQAAIDDGSGPETLHALTEVGPLLIAQEAARGGASLNSPEQEIVVEDGSYRLTQRANLPVEDWNAQISLLTGMAAATIMIDQGAGILRTMPPAADDATAQLRRRTELVGVTWPVDQSYGDFLRSLDQQDPRTPAVIQAASALFRGADYAEFLSPDELPEHLEQAAIAAPYAHTTAPLRRLVDRYVLRAVTGDVDREVIPLLPEIMRESSSLASRLDAGAVDRIEAAVLGARLGEETFDAVVVSSTASSARVQLADPFLTATVPMPLTPGERVRVRVESTDIASGSVALVPESAPREQADG